MIAQVKTRLKRLKRRKARGVKLRCGATNLTMLNIQRRKALRITIELMLGMGIIAAYFLIGYHRHSLEILVAEPSRSTAESGEPLFRIVSKQSPFEVINPEDPETTPSFTIGDSTSYRRSDNFESRRFAGRGSIRSRQVVELAPAAATTSFIVNGVTFSLYPDRLEAAGRSWMRRPNEFVEISIDELSQ